MTTPIWEAVKFDDLGLAPAVIQDQETLRVLMVGYMNQESLRRTVAEGRVTFWSRSRQEFWRKGDTSGHMQFVESIELDCDRDTILIHVSQVGAACHTGLQSCFDTHVIDSDGDVTEVAGLDAHA